MPATRDAWAVFLDMDGTLAPIAATPAEAGVPPAVVERLHELHALLDGALALVSGRPIADLDRMTAPLRLPAAGVHGAESRAAAGAEPLAIERPGALDAARRELAAFVAVHPGTIVEDKTYAVALHFRRHPEAGKAASRLMRQIVATGGAGIELLEGDMVVELRPRGVNKGAAVQALLEAPPFAGRRPVYLGDDVTDEDAFRAVNDLGGISVRVGSSRGSAARCHLASVHDVHDWLDRLAAHLGADAA